MCAVFFKHSIIGLGWQVISVNTGLDMPVICTISKSESCTIRKFDAMGKRIVQYDSCVKIIIFLFNFKVSLTTFQMN